MMDSSFLSDFDSRLSDPLSYLEPSSELARTCQQGLRNVFLCCKASGGRAGPLDDLYLEGFDDNGVWEEIELLNCDSLSQLSETVGVMCSWGHVVIETLRGAEGGEEVESEEGGEVESEEGVEVESEEEGVEVESEEGGEEVDDLCDDTAVKPKSSVDDQFFKLSEMEDFLEQAENGFAETEDINLFRDWSSDEEQENARYHDMFGVSQSASSHERLQMKLKKQILQLEADNIRDKSWQMSGEVEGKARPVNSLLEEALDYEHMTRPPPTITEETTQTLEEMIRRRIIDEAWDDVERKLKPKEKPYHYSVPRPLDQEKSKLSLAEVYEQEYVKQTQERAGDHKDPLHSDIQRIMKLLFLKLDALSNFHFTPKPPKAEVKIISHAPAIAMEEVTPTATSDVTLLAPEELQAHPTRTEKGSSEKSITDKLRERRQRKRRKRLQVAQTKLKEKHVNKLRLGLGNKYSQQHLKHKLGDSKDDSALRSSSKFFARLQEEVREEMKNKQFGNMENRQKTTSSQTFKL